jgi:hypothetical protein
MAEPDLGQGYVILKKKPPMNAIFHTNKAGTLKGSTVISMNFFNM